MTSPISAIDQLLAAPEPYAALTPDDDARFAAAMAECDALHRARNPRYAQLWRGDERSVVPAGLFKRADLATPVDDDGVWLTSSRCVGARRMRPDERAGRLRRWVEQEPVLPGPLDPPTLAFCRRKLRQLAEPGLLRRKLEREITGPWQPLGRVLLVISEHDVLGTWPARSPRAPPATGSASRRAPRTRC